MYLFFGDERKNISTEIFSMLLYSIKQDQLPLVSRLIKHFKYQNNLHKGFEFHFYYNDRVLKKKFIEFIVFELIETEIIEKIYYTQVSLFPEPSSHILALNELVKLIITDLPDAKVTFVIDKLGGKVTETEVKTQFGRICRHHNIKLKKTLICEDSKKSDFIQIADYLVALKDKGLI
jgi:hypothetical protein